MPDVSYPFTIESRLSARVKRLFMSVFAGKRESIQANLRRQDDGKDQAFFEALEKTLKASIDESEAGLRALFLEIYQHGRGQFARLFKWEFDADPILNEPWARPMVEAATKDLIKKLHGTAGNFAEKARQATEEARRAQGGTIQRANSAIKKLRERAIRDAAYHVRNVAGNLNHDLTFRRFEDFGIEEYEWITRHDRRVRGRPDGLYPHARYSHWDRHGEVYAVTHRHPDGRPGEPNACRCIARPVFPDYKRQPKKAPGWLLAFLAGIAAGAAYELSKDKKKPAV